MGFGMLPKSIEVPVIIVSMDTVLSICKFWSLQAVLHMRSSIYCLICACVSLWSHPCYLVKILCDLFVSFMYSICAIRF
jgi:hypothetical protein